MSGLRFGYAVLACLVLTGNAQDAASSNGCTTSLSDEDRPAGEQNQIRQYTLVLIREHGAILAGILQSHAVLRLEESYAYSLFVFQTYGFNLTHDIVAEAIDLTFHVLPTDTLSSGLRDVFRDVEALEGGSELVFGIQVDLFLKFVDSKLANANYVFQIAHYFRDIKRSVHSLSEQTSLRLDQAIDLLPSSVQYFLFRPQFCLLNAYFKQFIYCTARIMADDRNRFVLVWNEKEKIQINGGWSLIEMNSNDANRNCSAHLASSNSMQVKLMNDATKRSMYLASKIGDHKNIAVAWEDLNSIPALADEWKAELTDLNTWAFSQNDLVLCASDTLRSQYRRYAYAYDYVKSIVSTKCQWIAKECPFWK